MIITVKLNIEGGKVKVEEEILDEYLDLHNVDSDELTDDQAIDIGREVLEEGLLDEVDFQDFGNTLGGTVESVKLIDVTFEDDEEIDLP